MLLTKEEVAPRGYGFESAGGRPARNHGAEGVENIGFCDCEFRAEEHASHGHAEEHAAHEAVCGEEEVVGACAVEVSAFAAEFIADGLKDEAHEDEHPQPVGAAEACGVE